MGDKPSTALRWPGMIVTRLGQAASAFTDTLCRPPVTTNSPPVLTRSQYKAVWNSVSQSEEIAKIAVAGYADEEQFEHAGLCTLGMLRSFVDIRPDDVILEIGAGVGRVGAVLAPLCREWIGTDVSENMVGHIRRRLASFPNIRAVATNGYDLHQIPSNSVDLVYCTVVFMHLEEWERFSYVREGFRILRPGGRMLVDNVNLTSDEGWAFFMEHCSIPKHERPPNISKTSTPQELGAYFSRAGFVAIEQRELSLWITTFGWKPDASADGVLESDPEPPALPVIEEEPTPQAIGRATRLATPVRSVRPARLPRQLKPVLPPRPRRPGKG